MAGRIFFFCAHCGNGFKRQRPDNNSHIHCSVICRFWSKVDRSSNDAVCWNWTAKARANNGLGYGAFNAGGRSARAHRFAWELINGAIPKGMCVCHKCDNVLCCNPSHLFLGTLNDNVQDMRAKGRHWVPTQEHIEKLRLAKIGVPRSEETKRKLSMAGKNRKQSLESIAKRVAKVLGSKRSEATKERMRKAWVIRKANLGLLMALS